MSTVRFALGVGLTNACNLSCAHCYRGVGTDQLSVDQVLAAVEAVPTRAVNFGTGENALHPDFERLIRELHGRGVDVTVTTNGFSTKVLPDDVLCLLRDVEFSIDHPTRVAHDEARGAGNWDLIEEQMSRCRRLGVSSTLISVLMSNNYRALPALAALAGERGALLRVNVYQSVRGDAFALTYEQFWSAWRDVLEVADLVTCGEPIVRAVLGIPATPGAGCGVETIRITPRGAVVPCVYGGDAKLSLADLQTMGASIVEHPTFLALRDAPASCASCPQVETCRGGCSSRRVLKGGLDRPDEYCPFVRGEVPALSAQRATLQRAIPKASSACTTILRWRGAQPQ